MVKKSRAMTDLNVEVFEAENLSENREEIFDHSLAIVMDIIICAYYSILDNHAFESLAEHPAGRFSYDITILNVIERGDH